MDSSSKKVKILDALRHHQRRLKVCSQENKVKGKGKGNKTKTETWEVTAFRGERPRLQNYYIVQDNGNRKFYVYGSYCVGEESDPSDPSAHKACLYVCDTSNMEFTNLTDLLVYCPPGDRHLLHPNNRQFTPLPPLSCVGITFFELNGNPMIFIFGGHDINADVPTSNLIAIQLLHREWYYVDFEVKRNQILPANRIYPVVVGCNNRIYIFGGIGEYEVGWTPLRSYCVAKFSKQSHKCEWEAIDLPYPDQVKPGVIFGDGVTIHNEVMILLLPGLKKGDYYDINLKNDGIYYFLPVNSTFTEISFRGSLPKKVQWYYKCLDKSSDGRDPATPPSVIICTWTPYGKKYLSPEIWRFHVHPEDSVVSLNLRKKIFSLAVDFRRFALIGDKMYLMGQGGEEEISDEKSMIDSYIQIPL